MWVWRLVWDIGVILIMRWMGSVRKPISDASHLVMRIFLGAFIIWIP